MLIFEKNKRCGKKVSKLDLSLIQEIVQNAKPTFL